MDIIEKMIKEGIYNECNSDIYNSFIGKLIKRYRLMKTRDKRIKFIISIFNECKKEINFDFQVLTSYPLAFGVSYPDSFIDIYIKEFDKLALRDGNKEASIQFLYILFHELRHAIQYNDTTLNLKNYRMAKEDYIQTSEEKRISQLPKIMQMLEPNYYIENHDYFEFEIDANLRALVHAYKLLNKYNCKEFNEVFERLVCEFLSYRNTREYYDIENKFDSIFDCNVKPFDIEYDINGNRKSFEELFNNNLKDKALYNKLLLNKIKETGYAPNLLKNILYNEINKIKEDIKIQEYFGKDNYFLKNELKKLEKIK